jgi:hypothetical protein
LAPAAGVMDYVLTAQLIPGAKLSCTLNAD